MYLMKMIKDRVVLILTAIALAAGCFMCSTAIAETAVPADSPLVPSGLVPGDSFQLIFVTSTKTNRDSGNGEDNFPIDHWDEYVNNLADNSTLAGIKDIIWYAMVSVDNLSDQLPGIAAKDHAVVSQAVYRTDGELVATGYADIWDGSIAIKIDVDESGIQVNTSGSSGSGRQAYTGSTWDGDISPQFPMGNGTEGAITGSAEATGTGWFQGGGHLRRGPTTARRLYALSEVITVSDVLPPTLDAGNDMISWSGASFDLNPNVVNNNPQTGLTFAWSADPVAGVTVEFTATDIESPSVTLTKDAPTDGVTLVTLRLACNNVGSGLSDIEDTLIVYLYDDGCDAAIGAGEVVFDAGDFNEDCKTNIEDIALLAAKWLSSYEISEPKTRSY